jgi:hypothetical protein
MGPKIVQGLFSIRAGSGSNRTKCGVTCSLRDGCTYLQQIPFPLAIDDSTKDIEHPR